MTWHTVRFVNDAKPPHETNRLWKNWLNVRGQLVRIRMIPAESVGKKYADCKCEEFFQIHPDDVRRLSTKPISHNNFYTCRRMLEMD